MLALACVVAATIPDADILVGRHRTWSHSFAAALTFAVIIAVIARAARWPAWRVAVASGLAYASHVVLDWLGKDSATPSGVMALWPLSSTYFVSGLNIFAEVSRRYWKPEEFVWGNLQSVAIELGILGPIALVALWATTRRRRDPSLR